MAQLMPLHSLSLAPVNPDWFYLSGTSLPESSPGQNPESRKMVVVVVLVVVVVPITVINRVSQ